MKYLSIIISIFICTISSNMVCAQQKEGYDITINFKQPVSDEYIYLANYYAKALPVIYKKDSAAVSKNKLTTRFKSSDAIVGGLFVVFFNDRRHFIEIVIENGDQFVVDVDTNKLPHGATFIKSVNNELYASVNKNLEELRQGLKLKKDNLTNGSISNEDYYKEVKLLSHNVHLKNKAIADRLEANHLLKNIIYAIIPVEQNSGSADTVNIKYLQKESYWNNYNFKDDRLMYTPIYENKLRYYFDNLADNYIPDSLIYESEKLLYFTKGTKDHFRYTLNWLTQYAYNSKVMGIDEVFIHLVENYYMTGWADWLDEKTIDTYIKRAQAMAPNVLGKKGANITLSDLFTLKDYSLYDFKSNYTLLVFWSIDCGSCKKEMPKLKELYDSKLKQLGVKVLSIPNGQSQTAIKAAVEQYGISEWKHVIDIHGKSDYVEQYDAYTKPKIYLLDQDKLIIGKHLNHTNIEQVLQLHNKQ